MDVAAGGREVHAVEEPEDADFASTAEQPPPLPLLATVLAPSAAVCLGGGITPHATLPSFTPEQLADRCRCAAVLGDNAGFKLAQALSVLGACAPAADRGWASTGEAFFDRQSAYILHPPLTERVGRTTPAVRALAAALRGSLPVQCGRRFVGRSADDMLLVPALLARMLTRAAGEPSALEQPFERPILRDGNGQLLLGRHGAVALLQCVELADGRDGIDIFVCTERVGALPYAMLADALELLRLCTHECCPGAQSVIHVLGDGGLDETMDVDRRPSVPIGMVRAAAKASKSTVHFGGAAHDVLKLLGDEELRAIQVTAIRPPSATQACRRGA